MKIYLVRHAQKDTSSKDTVKEHYHRGLTDIGLQQAELLAEKLSPYSINKIYSSDMLRAVQTANVVVDELHFESLLQKERNLREADPCIDPNYPNREEVKIKCWSDWNFKPENGESYNEGKDRFSKYFWNNIVAKNDDKDNILVVSHGRVMRLFLSDFLEDGEKSIKEIYKHVAITELFVDKDKKTLKVMKYNDNSYLPDKLKI